ncbi:MAG: polysaccharide deacetylase [Pseudomonadota bacterium]|nr:polysaccharide deacetylase [Pseudomonadota bacterium]
MDYPFIPMPHRGKLELPGNNRLAVIPTINLEYWDLVKPSKHPYYAGGPPILPDALPGDVPDFPNFSWREYGQRVGVWRMIKEFDQAGVSPSCTVNAKLIEKRWAIVEAVKERNWELVAHNYEQGDLLTNYAHNPAEERELIERSLEVFEKAIGKKARGWLSCSLRGTTNTCEILVDNGLIFFCDLMNDDQPYIISTPKGKIVATPYSIEVNDFTFFTRRGLDTDGAIKLLIEQFDVLYEEAAETGLVMNIGLHPHVAGVPHRIRALREFLAYAKSFKDVWWPTREELAVWYMENHQSHIPNSS